MSGTSDTQFDPHGNITIGQATAIGARLHSLYYNDNYTFKSTTPWYQSYVDYATSKGIIESTASFSSLCSRESLAAILFASLPASEFSKINSISEIPDVDNNRYSKESIYSLYNAGVLTGNDEYGTFKPNNYITRAETAAIVTRIIDKSSRVKFSLTKRVPKDYPIEDQNSNLWLFTNELPRKAYTTTAKADDFVDKFYYVIGTVTNIGSMPLSINGANVVSTTVEVETSIGKVLFYDLLDPTYNAIKKIYGKNSNTAKYFVERCSYTKEYSFPQIGEYVKIRGIYSGYSSKYGMPSLQYGLNNGFYFMSQE